MHTKTGNRVRNNRSKQEEARRRKAIERFPFDLAHAYLLEHHAYLRGSEFRRISGHIRARRFDLLSGMNDVGDVHSSASRVRVLRQLRAFFSKNAQFTDTEKAKAAAISSFLEGERRCRITNKRIAYYSANPLRLGPLEAYRLEVFRAKLSEVLGSPLAFLESIPGNVRLTSGATESTSRSLSVPFMKLKGYCRVPRRSLPLVESLAKYNGVDTPSRWFDVDYNRLAFVSKNWKTMRVIACEPAHLLPFQLAFDAYIKRRLQAVFGIDLTNQKRNTEAARAASVTGIDATIDLKGASDSLSCALVRCNVTTAWWDILRRLRVEDYSSEDLNGTYSKYSSMGNGVTFGLETAIFACAAYACGVDSPIVYGDDIVVPVTASERLVRFLRFLGFRTNVEKTFISGPFRESCGGDFWSGVDVTPVYLRASIWDRGTRHLIWNGMRARCSPHGEVARFLRKAEEVAPVLYIPYSSDETAGVWVHPTVAWNRGLVRRETKRSKDPFYSGCVYKGLRTTSVRISCARSSRALEMWFLRAEKFGGRNTVYDAAELVRGHVRAPVLRVLRSTSGVLTEPIICSQYSSTHTRTSVELVQWVVPTAPVPPHLMWWELDIA